MGSVGANLKAGFQGVKENKEILSLRDEVKILREQLAQAKAEGDIPDGLNQKMEILTDELAKETGIVSIGIELIDRDDNQPRTVFAPETIRERVESMRRFGQKTPIILIPKADARFKLFDGELRYRAAKFLNWNSLHAVFLDPENVPEDITLFESQVITSIHSKRLHDLDLAYALLRLLRSRYDNFNGIENRIPTILNTAIRRLERSGELTDIAEIRLAEPEEQYSWLDELSFKEMEERQIFEILLELQLNPQSINVNVFPLLKLSEDIVEAIRADGLESSKAREINKITTDKLQIDEKKVEKIRQEVIDQVLDEGLSLTKTKALVNSVFTKYAGDVQVNIAPHKYCKAVDKIDISLIEDLETLKLLKKSLNGKLKEINEKIKNCD